jgi:hypothetical protein
MMLEKLSYFWFYGVVSVACQLFVKGIFFGCVCHQFLF